MLYRFLRPIVKFILHILYRFEIENIENVPSGKSVLICANHVSFMDFAFIGAHIKTPISYLGKAEIAKYRPIAAFLRALGFIPIKRGAADVNAIKSVINTLEEGRSVLMFPQGTRKGGKQISETNFKSGAALVGRKSSSDVVPVSITAKDMKAKVFGKISLRFGEPIPSQRLYALSDAEATDLIKEEIILLAEKTK